MCAGRVLCIAAGQAWLPNSLCGGLCTSFDGAGFPHPGSLVLLKGLFPMTSRNASQAHKLLTFIGIALCSAALPIAANAASKTVTLAIPSMDCPVCPITIKKALLQVRGIDHASVDFAKRQAVVTFDDAKTSVQTLTDSTKNAGYPSTVAKPAN